MNNRTGEYVAMKRAAAALSIISAFLLTPVAGTAHAEETPPAAGLYIPGEDGGRILVAAGVPALPDTITIFVPAADGASAPVKAAVTRGARMEASEDDSIIMPAPVAWAVSRVPGDGGMGIAALRLDAGGQPDADANGIPETPFACLGTESIRLALTEKAGDDLRLVWHVAVPLGYDTEPNCPDAFFAAVEALDP